jgi:hypothetical protein
MHYRLVPLNASGKYSNYARRKELSHSVVISGVAR